MWSSPSFEKKKKGDRSDGFSLLFHKMGSYDTIPLKTQEAKYIASKLNRFISIFGMPLQIHIGLGSNFESKTEYRSSMAVVIYFLMWD